MAASQPYYNQFEFRVGAGGNYSDGDSQPARLGNAGDLIVSDLNAKYYEQTVRGNMFVYTVTVGAALLLSATTGNCQTIWNPSGSGKIFVPVAVRCSFLSGTTTIGSVLFALTANCGSTIAATAPIVTFTNAVGRNANLGSGKASVMYHAPAVCTFVAAPTVIAATGLNFGAAAPTGPGTYEVLLDGSLVLQPGNALSIVYSVTTSTSLWFTTIWGLELATPSLA